MFTFLIVSITKFLIVIGSSRAYYICQVIWARSRWRPTTGIQLELFVIGPFVGSGHMYGINYAGTQVTRWDFQNKGKSGWTGSSSFVLRVPLGNLPPSMINSVPCYRIVQRAYWIPVIGYSRD